MSVIVPERCDGCGFAYFGRPLSLFYALLFQEGAQQKRLDWIAKNDPNETYAHSCPHGTTPLHLVFGLTGPTPPKKRMQVTGQEALEMARLLLDRGANVDSEVKCCYGETPLICILKGKMPTCFKDEERYLMGKLLIERGASNVFKTAAIEKLKLIFNAYGAWALDGSSGAEPALMGYVKRPAVNDERQVGQSDSPSALEFLLGIGLSPFLSTEKDPTLSCKLIYDSILDPNCFWVVMKYVKPADVERFNNQEYGEHYSAEARTCNLFRRCIAKDDEKLPMMSLLLEKGFKPDNPRSIPTEQWLTNFSFTKQSHNVVLEILNSLPNYNVLSDLCFAILHCSDARKLENVVDILIGHSGTSRAIETTALGAAVIKMPVVVAFLIRVTFRRADDTNPVSSAIYDMLKKHANFGERSPNSSFHSSDVLIAAAAFGWPSILSDTLAAACCEPLKVLCDLEALYPTIVRTTPFATSKPEHLRDLLGYAELVLSQYAVRSSQFKSNCRELHKALGGSQQPGGSWAQVFADFRAMSSLQHMCRVKIRECISGRGCGGLDSEIRSKIEQLPLLSFRLRSGAESDAEVLPQFLQDYLLYEHTEDKEHAAMVLQVNKDIKSVTASISFPPILRHRGETGENDARHSRPMRRVQLAWDDGGDNFTVEEEEFCVELEEDANRETYWGIMQEFVIYCPDGSGFQLSTGVMNR